MPVQAASIVKDGPRFFKAAHPARAGRVRRLSGLNAVACASLRPCRAAVPAEERAFPLFPPHRRRTLHSCRSGRRTEAGASCAASPSLSEPGRCARSRAPLRSILRNRPILKVAEQDPPPRQTPRGTHPQQRTCFRNRATPEAKRREVAPPPPFSIRAHAELRRFRTDGS